MLLVPFFLLVVSRDVSEDYVLLGWSGQYEAVEFIFSMLNQEEIAVVAPWIFAGGVQARDIKMITLVLPYLPIEIQEKINEAAYNQVPLRVELI